MTFKEICTEKIFFLTFVNCTGRILLVERLPECLPAISVCSVCAAKKSHARRSPIDVRVNKLCGNTSCLYTQDNWRPGTRIPRYLIHFGLDKGRKQPLENACQQPQGRPEKLNSASSTYAFSPMTLPFDTRPHCIKRLR